MPLSRDPDKRARQLANLTPQPPAPPARNSRAVRHGGYSKVLLADVSDEVLELMEALGELVPVRGPDGGVRASHLPGLEAAARALRRYRQVSAWCDLHGRIDDKTGATKPAAVLELGCERAYWRALDAFGLTPQAEGRLADVLTRTASVAQAMSEEDPDRRRRLLREAGVRVDDEAAEDG